MNIYYLGVKKNTIQYTNFFKGAILLKGECNEEDINYEKLYGKEIEYNDMDRFEEISLFYTDMMKEIKKKDKDALFIPYNQATIEFIDEIDSILCVNDINLIKTINHKPKCRELFKNEINSLKYLYLNPKDITFENISNQFEDKYFEYVIQQPVGFSGTGTYILDKDDSKDILSKLNPEYTYSVSGYIEDNIPINNTFIISSEDIIIFPGSEQLIKVSDKLEYDGYNFDVYKTLNKKVLKKAYKQTLSIAKKLQELGYKGIGGVDYIVSGLEVYFM